MKTITSDRAFYSKYKIPRIDNFKDIANKTVIVRVDYNIPLDDQYKPLDLTRVKHSVQTINYLVEKGAKVILLSHLTHQHHPSFAPLIETISETLGHTVTFLPEYSDIEHLIRNQENRVYLGENLRLNPGEESNTVDFLKPLIKVSDLYVNEAFPCCHRVHASLDSLPRYLPSYAGFDLVEELTTLEEYINAQYQNDKRLAIIGGKKVSTKLPLVASLCRQGFLVALGGAITNTIYHALGYPVGNSYHEKEMAEQVIALYKNHHQSLLLPTDFAYVDSNGERKIALVEDLPNVNEMESGKFNILDIGPRSQEQLQALCSKQNLVVWNGPLGHDSDARFVVGTHSVAKAIAELTSQGIITSIVGGGDTIAALQELNVLEEFSHVSTGGGAFLSWLQDNNLPALAALR